MKIAITVKSDTRTATTFNVFKRTSRSTKQLVGIHRQEKESCRHMFTELHRNEMKRRQKVLTEEQMAEVFSKVKKLIKDN